MYILLLLLYAFTPTRTKTIECQNVECPSITCPNKGIREGECCPACLNNCYYHGEYYQHGDVTSPKKCVTCKCDDGVMMCDKHDPAECPTLECSPENIIRVQNECCDVCRDTDFCAIDNDCHVNSTCVNLATKYACSCNHGFQGDGKQCEDVDECLNIGGKFGHHCRGNQRCVNTMGSYECRTETSEERAREKSKITTECKSQRLSKVRTRARLNGINPGGKTRSELCEKLTDKYVEPITCPDSTVVHRGITADICVPCPDKTGRHTETTSFRNDGCYPYEDQPYRDCAYGDHIPSLARSSSKCPLRCECDKSRCYYGDPCLCRLSKPCPVNEELNDAGQCEKCKIGFIKPEIGCHSCVPIEDITPRYYIEGYTNNPINIRKHWCRYIQNVI